MFTISCRKYSLLFLVGRTLKLAKQAYNVTNSTNPVDLLLNSSITVAQCCYPTPINLAIHCIAVWV